MVRGPRTGSPGPGQGAAEDLLGLAHDLEVKVPGTKAAFRAGIVNALGRTRQRDSSYLA